MSKKRTKMEEETYCQKTDVKRHKSGNDVFDLEFQNSKIENSEKEIVAGNSKISSKGIKVTMNDEDSREEDKSSKIWDESSMKWDEGSKNDKEKDDELNIGELGSWKGVEDEVCKIEDKDSNKMKMSNRDCSIVDEDSQIEDQSFKPQDESHMMNNDLEDDKDEFNDHQDNFVPSCEICRSEVAIIGKANHWLHNSFIGLWLSMGETSIDKHLKKK